MRPAKLLWLLVFSILLFLLPSYAQIHGVPPSVTSFGFGGDFSPAPGVPASVTSLGPNGYSFGPCCFDSSFQGFQFSNSDSGSRHHRHDESSNSDSGSRHHRHDFGPIYGSGYASYYAYPYPIAVPVEADAYADDQGYDDYASQDPPVERRRSRPKKEDLVEVPEPAPKPAESPSIQAADQPITVLIFKDGHKLDVENYAIVGSTIFVFSNGLTHKFQLADLDISATQKVNDDRGIEFQAPSAGG